MKKIFFLFLIIISTKLNAGFTLSGTVITQSGTDANPSGLAAIAGVITTTDASASTNNKVFTYDIGNLQLVINGSLTIPKNYYIKAQSASAGNSITVNSGGTLFIDGSYTFTRNGVSTTAYSELCGIIIRKPSGVPYSINTMYFDNGSTFKQFGGILESSGTLRWNATAPASGKLITRNALWYIYDRDNFTYMNIYIPIDDIDVDGLTIFGNGSNLVGFFKNPKAGGQLNRYRASGANTALSPIDGNGNKVTLTNYIAGESIFDFKFRYGGTVSGDAGANPGGFDFINANIGNNLLPDGWNNNQNTGRARHYITYQPTFLNTITNAALTSGRLYMVDANNGSRTTTNGVPNDKIYNNTLNTSGQTPVLNILTKVWSAPGAAPWMYHDDRLPVSGYLWSYQYSGLPVNITSSIGPQTPILYVPIDYNITQSTEATAGAITGIALDHTAKTITISSNRTLCDVYDYIKYNKVNVNTDKPTLATMAVTVNGGTLELGAYKLIISGTAKLQPCTKFEKITSNIVGTIPTPSTNLEVAYTDPNGTYKLIRLQNITSGTVTIKDNNTNTVLRQETNYTGDINLVVQSNSNNVSLLVTRIGYTNWGTNVNLTTADVFSYVVVQTSGFGDPATLPNQELELYLLKKLLQKSQAIQSTLNNTTVPTLNENIISQPTAVTATIEKQQELIELLKRVLSKITAIRETVKK